MPVICTFYGIIVRMYHRDHGPAHIHVQYAQHSATVRIADGAFLHGSVPVKARRMVAEWCESQREALLAAWACAQETATIPKVEPLE
jgi:hypothetical protein